MWGRYRLPGLGSVDQFTTQARGFYSAGRFGLAMHMTRSSLYNYSLIVPRKLLLLVHKVALIIAMTLLPLLPLLPLLRPPAACLFKAQVGECEMWAMINYNYLDTQRRPLTAFCIGCMQVGRQY